MNLGKVKKSETAWLIGQEMAAKFRSLGVFCVSIPFAPSNLHKMLHEILFEAIYIGKKSPSAV